MEVCAPVCKVNRLWWQQVVAFRKASAAPPPLVAADGRVYKVRVAGFQFHPKLLMDVIVSTCLLKTIKAIECGSALDPVGPVRRIHFNLNVWLKL